MRAKDRDNSAGDYSSPNRGAGSRGGRSRCRPQSCCEKRISSGSDANWDTAAKFINSAAYLFFAKSYSGVPGEDRRPWRQMTTSHDTGKFVLFSKTSAPDALCRV